MSKSDQWSIDRLMGDVMRGGVSRRSFLKRAAALGLAAPTISILLVACGDDDDDATSTPDAAAPTATAGSGGDEATATTDTGSGDEATATTDAGSGGEPTATTDGGSRAAPSGEIVIMQGVDANNLDPLLRNATPEFTVNMHVFDMMLNRNSETLEITPNIVES